MEELGNMLTREQLEQMDEESLHTKVLIPLFKAIGFEDVYLYHGRQELGKDIVMWRKDEIGNRENYAVVVKAHRITGSVSRSVNELETQVRQCFHSTFKDPIGDADHSVHKCYVVSSHEIGKEAVEALRSALGSDINRSTEFIGGSKLWDLIEKHLKRGPEKIYFALPPTNLELFFGREEELEMLDEAWSNPKTNLVCLVAWGGVGKTALVNKWLKEKMVTRENRAPGYVYADSFYNQGASEDRQVSADLFISKALEWFGDEDPTKGSSRDKGERLAQLVRKKRTLLILDGLEPLQYPPGPMEGRIKDPGLDALLRELYLYNPGLCIVTTRLGIADFSGQKVELKHLSPQAGAQLLSEYGVKGTQEELEQVSQEFDGHALALILLGSLLRDAYGGDIRFYQEVQPSKEPGRQGEHARRVMESYETWLGEGPELCILRLMGLFDRPAESRALRSLRDPPPIVGLTDALFYREGERRPLNDQDWGRSVIKLRRARLILEEGSNSHDTLDAHPLIREYFVEKLRNTRPKEWETAHKRLYEYYRSQVKESPKNIEDMSPFFDAVKHGCHAGGYQEAYELLLNTPEIPMQLRRWGFSQKLAECCQLLLPAVLNDEQRRKLLHRWNEEKVLTSEEYQAIQTLFSKEKLGGFITGVHQALMDKWSSADLLAETECHELDRLWFDSPAGEFLEPLQQAEILFYLADANCNRGHPRIAIPLYRLSLDLITVRAGKKRISLMRPNEMNSMEKEVLQFIAKTYRAIATAFSNLGFSIPTIYYVSVGARIAESAGDMRIASLCYGHWCLELGFLAQFDQAYQRGRNALKCCPEEDKGAKSRDLCDIASTLIFDAKFRNQEQIRASLILCAEATLLSIEANAERSIGRCLVYLTRACAEMALSRSNEDKEFYLLMARKFAIFALSENIKVGDLRRIGNACSNVGAIYLGQNEPEKALAVYQAALGIHEARVGNTRTIAHDMIDLAGWYDLQGKSGIADRFYQIALAKRPESEFLIRRCIDNERFESLQNRIRQSTQVASATIDLGDILELEMPNPIDVDALLEQLMREAVLGCIGLGKFVDHGFIMEQLLRDLGKRLIEDVVGEQVTRDIGDVDIRQALREHSERFISHLN